MKVLKIFLLIFSVLLIMSFGFATRQNQVNENLKLGWIIINADTSQWIAPESANDLVNPLKANADNLEEGEMLYRKHCRSCHGRLGDGKGAGAAELETPATDFRQPGFLDQSDGSMFWKIAEGRDEMVPYKEKVTEEDIWLMVIYIKSFATAGDE